LNAHSRGELRALAADIGAGAEARCELAREILEEARAGLAAAELATGGERSRSKHLPLAPAQQAQELSCKRSMRCGCSAGVLWPDGTVLARLCGNEMAASREMGESLIGGRSA
jgi:hypothetical protein